MDEPWDESDDDQAPPGAAYPLPEATMAGDGTFLAALAAAILGILLFWRRKKPDEE